ncbi:MAG TPA: ABC transporter ATP-binding protein [Candidatus Faecousia excrementigallinarum]|uniref:ABC transporter ATP-binding protein n=1 Tax=Candidatus Faecousia excrementigallinarum TaxID=2840806 RepID=A0A9D0Z1U8_9FIRM|nr:ABC transporter ATP-binding protein [Candidatus Faecousia excrementigallinarum]
MKKLLKYMKGYEKECILGPLFKLLEASFELCVPLVVAGIVDVGIANSDRGYILKMCGLLVLLGAVGFLSSVVAQYFAAKAAVGFAVRLRNALMHHVLGLSYTDVDTLGTGSLITRMTSDINQVQNGVNLTLRLLLRSPFVVFGAMIMAFTIDFQSALVFAGVIPLLCVIVFGIMLVTMPLYRRVQSRLEDVTSATRQNFSGVRVLRAFNKEESQVREFKKKTEELNRVQIFAGRISALLNPITFVVINVGIILLVHQGALKVHQGLLTQGMVIALYNYMSQILVELIKMANLIINMTKAAACGSRVEKVLEMRPSGKGTAGAEKSLDGKVSFDHVTFTYAGSSEPSLEDVTFTAQPGQMVGIIGGTGSGKTTLVNLIPGFYTCREGSVTLDDRNVEKLSHAGISRQIGLVPQKSVLFRGTIRENLQWRNPEASDEDMKKALEIAQALEVVEGKGGLDAPVEQAGLNFSGGQRQRLAIARALVGSPRILILDDSASALDFATDARLRQAIRNMPNAPTTFVVSQRAASVRYADLILVLEDGQVVGQGTHEELLEGCQVYQEIYYSQFPEEVKAHG